MHIEVHQPAKDLWLVTRQLGDQLQQILSDDATLDEAAIASQIEGDTHGLDVVEREVS